MYHIFTSESCHHCRELKAILSRYVLPQVRMYEVSAVMDGKVYCDPVIKDILMTQVRTVPAMVGYGGQVIVGTQNITNALNLV